MDMAMFKHSYNLKGESVIIALLAFAFSFLTPNCTYLEM